METSIISPLVPSLDPPMLSWIVLFQSCFNLYTKLFKPEYQHSEPAKINARTSEKLCSGTTDSWKVGRQVLPTQGFCGAQ